MNAPAPITVTPVFVADLLAESDRMPVYVHVIHHPVGTHPHFDHCGGDHLFAGKPIYVQRRGLLQLAVDRDVVRARRAADRGPAAGARARSRAGLARARA